MVLQQLPRSLGRGVRPSLLSSSHKRTPQSPPSLFPPVLDSVMFILVSTRKAWFLLAAGKEVLLNEREGDKERKAHGLSGGQWVSQP